MLTSLTIARKIGKQAQKQPTLTGIHGLFKAQGLIWKRIEFMFLPDGSKASSRKSVKAIAIQNVSLQPHYKQKILNRAVGEQQGWQMQNFSTFAEAIAYKNNKQPIYSFIAWELSADAPDCEETLHAVDDILATYPQKNFQYKFQGEFIGLHFGAGTVVELPEEYANGRGPLLQNWTTDPLHGSKWAASHLRFGKDKYGSSLLIHCLLGESYNAPEKKNAMPEEFAALATSLDAFKAKEVMRRAIYSVEESDDHYAKLTAEQRSELDSRIFVFVIGLEQALYHQITGHDFADPLPAADDNAKLHAYLVTLSHAVRQADNAVNRPYNIGTLIQNLKQAAAKAMHDGAFTSFEMLGLHKRDEKLLAYRERRKQLMEDARSKAQQHLAALLAEGKLPHRLERFYFLGSRTYMFRRDEQGNTVPDPRGRERVPYHQVWVPDDQAVPPTLQAMDYRRDALRPLFENLKQSSIQLDSVEIDGAEYPVLPAVREKFDRRKIIGAVFKPLGYEFVKQSQGSVGTYMQSKSLSETESLRCNFDFGTWRQTIDCFFSYHNSEDDAWNVQTFSVPLAGWSYPESVDISSEELFTKTIENLGAMAAIIETEHIPELRQALTL